MHHDWLEFIPGVQGRVAVRDSVNVICQLINLRNQTVSPSCYDMIISKASVFNGNTWETFPLRSGTQGCPLFPVLSTLY